MSNTDGSGTTKRKLKLPWWDRLAIRKRKKDRDDSSSTTSSQAPVVESSSEAAREPSPPPSGLVEETRTPRSAYQDAWAKLEQSEQNILKGDQDLVSRFQKLSKADESSQRGNILRKGATKLQPWITGLQGTLALANPFLSLEPTAATATGIIGGALSIAALLCGSMDWITGDIQAFLDVLPAVLRCEEAVVTHSKMDDVYNVLVDMYTNLFAFYLATHNMFEKTRSTLTVLIIKKPSLTGITASFKGNQEKLSMLINSVTFSTVQAVKDDLADILIQRVLSQDSDSDIKFLNSLNDRSDQACGWIDDDAVFKQWLITPKPEVLFLLGEMGVGKTTVSAYVRDVVRRKHVVCIHYFKDDQSTTQPVNVYRTIVLQLLKQRPDLKVSFRLWYDAAVPVCSGEPVNDQKKMGEFLKETLLKSELWTFVILDGLDECEFRHAKSLVEQFKDIVTAGARLKLYVASRHNQHAEGFLTDLSPLASRVDFSPTAARDRLLTSHLLKQVTSSQKLFAKATDILAKKAEGSAIWLKLAVEYLQKCSLKTEFGLQEALKHLPASKDTGLMYGKLYTKIVGSMPDLPGLHGDDLGIALEILAVARRPLSRKELSVAVYTNRPDRPAPTLIELEERAFAFDLIDYIHPFLMRIPEDEYSFAPGLRLVHHSLKELILASPPSAWSSLNLSTGPSFDRQRRLESAMMDRCIKYLLYKECNEKEVDVTIVWTGWRSSDENNAILLNLASKGGLGLLFSYAASQWLQHFSSMHLDHPPQWSDIEALCDPRSPRSMNWVNAFTRFGLSDTNSLGTYWPSREKLDPLYVTASAGCARMLSTVIENKIGDEGFMRKLPLLLAILIDRESVDALDQILDVEACWPIFTREMVFVNILLQWCKYEEPKTPRSLDVSFAFRSKVSEADLYHPAASVQTQEAAFIRRLIKITLARSPAVILGWANELLCSSARRGNITLLQCLLESAAGSGDLRRALVTPKRRPWVGRRIPLHQTIGESLMGPYPEAARLLLKRGGFDSHIAHVAKGNTIWHATFSVPETLVDDKLDILMELLPEGKNEVNADGDTPFDIWLNSLLRFSYKHEGFPLYLYEPRRSTKQWSEFWERALEAAKILRARGLQPKRWFDVHGCLKVSGNGAPRLCEYIHGVGSGHVCG